MSRTLPVTMLVVVDLQSVPEAAAAAAAAVSASAVGTLCLCRRLSSLSHCLCAGSEMSGGVRNVTYRNSRLGGGAQSRGIDIKPSVGRGGFMIDMSFENIHVPKNINFGSDS